MTGSVAITRTQSHDCMSAWTFEQTFTHKDHTSSLYNWSPRDIKWKQQPIRDTGKNLNFYAGRDWGQEEKGTTEDEMAGWHHWLDGCESQWTPGVGDGQEGLACCDSWGRKELDMTERLIWSDVRMLSHMWLCNPMDCSSSGSSVHGISQARILEWVAISYSTTSITCFT